MDEDDDDGGASTNVCPNGCVIVDAEVPDGVEGAEVPLDCVRGVPGVDGRDGRQPV